MNVIQKDITTINFKEKIADYFALAKLRLASLVVYSAGLGYGLGLLNPKTASFFSWSEFTFLIIGGFLVTGSSNGINQIIERKSDKLMGRTKNRPLPSGRMQVPEAIIASIIMGLVGLYCLYSINEICFILGLSALVSYAFIYTPLKKVTPLSVFVGAFPGSIPPMIGYVAATGTFGLEPGILFFVQFVWQFPHFWAIAWKGSEDYEKGGFKMLPYGNKKDKKTAFIILFYTLFVIPTGMLPWAFGISGVTSMILAVVLGVYFLIPAIKLYQTCKDEDALKLMFASFVYLPLVFLFYFLDVYISTLI
jgi:protoheme IX farnesyltransferase